MCGTVKAKWNLLLQRLVNSVCIKACHFLVLVANNNLYKLFLFPVTPSPVKGKGKAGRPTASKTTKEKTPSPKEEDEEPESPPEKKKSASPPPEKSGDEGSEEEAPSGED